MRDDELTTISSREVGARMRRLREERGLSAADVAGALGVTEGQLAAWESGQGVAPYETIRALAAALGTTADAFVS
jgi:transcriptional regulator with XRE-family HTH domain